MENNSSHSENFSIDDYNAFLRQIKAGTPVHKINFTIDNPNAIIGMYLIAMNDMETYLKKLVDLSDTSDNTLLVFESRHVIECCQIIYGCMDILNTINFFDKKYYSSRAVIGNIVKILLSKPIYYNDAMEALEDSVTFIIATYSDSPNTKEYEKMRKKYLYLIKNIWFIPYAHIDNIAADAKKYFEESNNGETNE